MTWIGVIGSFPTSKNCTFSRNNEAISSNPSIFSLFSILFSWHSFGIFIVSALTNEIPQLYLLFDSDDDAVTVDGFVVDVDDDVVDDIVFVVDSVVVCCCCWKPKPIWVDDDGRRSLSKLLAWSVFLIFVGRTSNAIRRFRLNTFESNSSGIVSSKVVDWFSEASEFSLKKKKPSINQYFKGLF